VTTTTAVLTIEMLAGRWSVPVENLRRRMGKLNLPAVNVGTDKAPDYRFRLSAIEAWEAANETTLGQPAAVGKPVAAGAPPGLEGYDPYGGKAKKKGRGVK
jgi:hypothetical protein